MSEWHRSDITAFTPQGCAVSFSYMTGRDSRPEAWFAAVPWMRRYGVTREQAFVNLLNALEEAKKNT